MRIGLKVCQKENFNKKMNKKKKLIVTGYFNRQGLKVASLEEIAYKMNYIDTDQVKKLAIPLLKITYGQYLLNLVK